MLRFLTSMDPRLAYDILELIIDKVDLDSKSTLAALCLTTPAFFAFAQKQLYKSFTIDTTTREEKVVRRRTLFVRSVQENPALRLLVQSVTCILGYPAYGRRLADDIEQILNTLGKMSNVASFSLRSTFQDIYCFDSAPAVLRDAFLSICVNPNLRSLELSHIMNFPCQVLLLVSGHLEILRLNDCMMVGYNTWHFPEVFERAHR